MGDPLNEIAAALGVLRMAAVEAEVAFLRAEVERLTADAVPVHVCRAPACCEHCGFCGPDWSRVIARLAFPATEGTD